MSDGLGSMANAPLAFVLAQIRLLLPSSFDRKKVSHAMHDKLFSDFPQMQEVKSQRLVIEADGTAALQEGESIHSLASIDLREEVLISQSFLAFQVTKYVDYPTFSIPLAKAVEAMFATYGPLAVQQVGLRYIDFIYPEPGMKVNDYLPAATSFIDVAGKVEENSLRASDVQMDGARAVIRISQGRGKATLPADLSPVLNLSPSPIMSQDPGPVSTAILDIDGYTNANMHRAASPEGMLAVFRELHDNVTAPIFRQLVTPEALKYWRRE